MANIIRFGGRAGSAENQKFGNNIFIQPTEPESKDGIWIQSDIAKTPTQYIDRATYSANYSYSGENNTPILPTLCSSNQSATSFKCCIAGNYEYVLSFATQMGFTRTNLLTGTSETLTIMSPSILNGDGLSNYYNLFTNGDKIFIFADRNSGNDYLTPMYYVYTIATNTWGSIVSLSASFAKTDLNSNISGSANTVGIPFYDKHSDTLYVFKPRYASTNSYSLSGYECYLLKVVGILTKSSATVTCNPLPKDAFRTNVLPSASSSTQETFKNSFCGSGTFYVIPDLPNDRFFMIGRPGIITSDDRFIDGTAKPALIQVSEFSLSTLTLKSISPSTSTELWESDGSKTWISLSGQYSTPFLINHTIYMHTEKRTQSGSNASTTVDNSEIKFLKYDLNTLSFTRLPSRPNPSGYVKQDWRLLYVEFQGRIFVFGGNNGTTSGTNAPATVFDSATETWSVLGNIPCLNIYYDLSVSCNDSTFSYSIYGSIDSGYKILFGNNNQVVFYITAENLPEGTLAILDGTKHKVSLLDQDKLKSSYPKELQGLLSTGENYYPKCFQFDKAWYYTHGKFETFDCYYGDGTQWTKIKN